MKKNIKRTMNVIAMRTLAVAIAMSMTLFSFVPVYALSYSLGYLDNGDGTLFDEDRGCYVSMDEYHAAYGYYLEDEYGMYTYRDENGVGFCSCSACEYMREGHNFVVPNEDNNNNAADNTSETETPDDAKPIVYILGKTANTDNAAGEGWKYDVESNSLTLENYNYEGTGMFVVADDSSNLEEEDADSSDESGDETDEEMFDDEDGEEWDETEEDEESDETEEDASDTESSKSIAGAIHSNGDLTLRLNGESHITITDENSDASYGVNVTGNLKVEGDGVLYVKSATEEKVYANEPIEDIPAGNSGTINNNDIDINNNDGDVNQNVNEGDVNINNNLNVPESVSKDIVNNITVPDVINNNTFNPNVTVELPKSSVERAIIRDAAVKSQSHDESVKNVNSETEPRVGAVDASNEDRIVTPETSDPRNWGAIFTLIGIFIMGAVALAVIAIRRYRETTIG